MTGRKAVRVSGIGASVARRLDSAPRGLGRVHSVFERAVNVLGDDDRLLTFHGPGRLAAPFAIALSEPLPLAAFAPGAALEATSAGLEIGGVFLDLRLAEVVDTAMTPRTDPGPLASAVGESQGTACGSALSSPRALDGRRHLLDGIARADARRFVDGARRLVGLGEGLTPAGDDFLVGALAILHAFLPGFVLGHPLIAIDLGAAARAGTTLVARDFLLHALDGRFSQVVLALVAAASELEARRLLAELLTMGATSGADTAAGMRVALAALAR